jgi:tRNA-dihydrouridine synthase B
MLKSICIGNVKLNNNVFLAPMAGVTDAPFRILCKEQGCSLVYTEMVSAKGMSYNNDKSIKLAQINYKEKPIGVQIFGSEPCILAKIAKRLDESEADIIDINMGCPTPKITKNGEGSALMLNPILVGRIVSEVSKATSKAVTVKIRKGWDEHNVNAVNIARIAEDNGASAVTIHGRTREQFYSQKADWDIIAEVKDAISIPVIGNGDIFSPIDAKSMFSKTNCDAIMIGRGARGNPWIFKRVLHYLATETILPFPNNSEKLKMIIRHMDMLIGLKGESAGIREMRKHIAWYIKGLRNSTDIKEKVFRLTSRDKIISLLDEFFVDLD